MAVIRTRATQIATAGMILGEGPIWVERDQALWCVDIKSQRIFRFDPATAELRSWRAPEQIGWIVPSSDGRFIVGLQTGLYRFDPATEIFVLFRAVEVDLPGNRLNDAVVDPSGHLWFGTMDNSEVEVRGRLYRFADGRVFDSGLPPVRITNGPAISPDGRTLYAVNTLAGEIDAFDVAEDGALSGRRKFVTIDPSDGYPDGAICDAEGGVWIGLFRGAAVRRYASDGTHTHQVDFPVSNVTKIALGGPGGRTAYATTARKGLGAQALAAEPLAGDLFTFEVEIPGVAPVALRLDY